MSAKRFVILSLCLILVFGFYAKTTLGANILYVANLRDQGFIDKDKIIQDYMRSLGHTVIPIDDQESEADTEAAAQAADIDLVYISETVGSGGIKNEITEIDVPMIIGEPWAWDEMGLDTGGGGGNNVATTDITIVNPAHPLAAGLSGTVAVLTDVSKDGAIARFARCFVGGDGIAIATWTDAAGTIFDVVMVYEKGDKLAQKPADGSSINAANTRIGIGFDERSFELWNDNAFLLLEAAINYIMRDIDSAQVVNPADGATDVDRQIVCKWIPGETAETHDVYFGTDFSNVSEASRTDTRDVLKAQAQEPNSFDPGLLALGTTYYWRVDEVKAAPDNTVSKGIVWSFTVEPYSIAVQSIVVTASSEDPEFTAENTINGSGLDEADLHGVDATTMWLSNAGDPAVWIQYAFDKAYKLDKMLVWNSNQELELVLGFGVKEVTLEVSTNGTDWTTLENVQQFAQSPGAAGYAANTIIDFNGAMVQFVRISVNSGYGPLGRYGLSEVRFLYIPTFATRPYPETGATDVAPDVILTWGRDGREASSHNVYFGLNPDDLTLAGTVSESSFDTLALDLQLGETYSWRVDEVNEAMDPSTWIGDVWSFRTADAISIDDMESYEDAELLEIWATWVDGFEDPTNGSLVGNGTAGTPETDLVHGGSQSLPMHYDNSAAAQSEATRTFKAPMDWTGHGVQGLVLYFQGSASNTGGSLYVKINDTKVAYDGDLAALMRGGWNKWYIPLADVAGNLSGITSLTIGIDGGGTGVVYVDDIFLTDGARELVTPAEPSNIGLAGHYKLDQDATDSSGNNNHGALGGDPQWVAGKIGSALDFDGDDYVDLGNPSQLDFGTGSWSVSAWMKMPASTDNSNIFSKGGDNSGGIRYMLNVSETDDHKACLTLDDNVTKVQSTSSVTVDDGQWHHIVGLRDGSSLRLYVDGALDGTNTLAAGYDLSGTSQANAYIGAGWNFDTSVVQKFLIGMIDDVRIYSQALSAEEIAWLAGRTQPFDKP
ncbi:MAG: LamG-like jellyroll fold domain-containing protein [Planctomycetota bacterium]|jgi:hypothetical protein